MAQEVVYQGKSWTTWTDELSSLAENTQIAYLKAFKVVADEWGMAPEAMFKQKMEELKSEDPRDRMDTEKRINKLMKELEDRGTAPEGARMVKKAMASFYSAQGLVLLFKRKNGKKNGHIGQKAISQDQIQMLIKTNGVRNLAKNTALYNVLNDSGLRVSDVANLTVGLYQSAEIVLSKYEEPFKVFDPARTQKCGVVAHVHLGPESVKSVDAYLAYREENGEILTEDSPLFLDRMGRGYTEKRLSNTISTTTRLRGLRRISAHSFRKRHKTQLETRMPLNWVLMLEGKDFNEYSAPTEAELTEAYMKSYGAIRIFGDSPDERKIDEELEYRRQTEASLDEMMKMIKQLQKE